MKLHVTAPFIVLFGCCLNYEISQAAAPPSIQRGNSICYEVQKFTNALVDYTDTRCWAAPSSRKAELLSFIIISSKPVFAVEASKKGWMIVTISAVGKILNEDPSIRTDEIWLSDVDLTKKRVVYALPTSVAKSLQRDAFHGRINVEQMYETIKKNLTQKSVTNDTLEKGK
jgi:hypothetical protein